jgi:4-hydroxybenzoate polyprenyltransferase
MSSASKLSLAFLLKVSRPGLWFQTLWLYTVPLGAGMEWRTPQFWLGALYMTWPLNLLVYGWNDSVDYEIDQTNPRKDTWLFGARGSREQLARLPPIIVLAQLPFLVAFVVWSGWQVALVLAAIVAVNAAYNARIGGLRGRPPLDVINPIGYVLVTLLGMQLNGVERLPVASFVYLALFCVHAQLVGEVMDFHADRATGRVTSCTRLGMVPTKWLIIALVAVEAILVAGVFRDWPLAAMLLFGAGWLVWDATVYGGGRQYSRSEMRFAGLAMNGAGLCSMVWVWLTGSIAVVPP